MSPMLGAAGALETFRGDSAGTGGSMKGGLVLEDTELTTTMRTCRGARYCLTSLLVWDFQDRMLLVGSQLFHCHSHPSAHH